MDAECTRAVLVRTTILTYLTCCPASVRTGGRRTWTPVGFQVTRSGSRSSSTDSVTNPSTQPVGETDQCQDGRHKRGLREKTNYNKKRKIIGCKTAHLQSGPCRRVQSQLLHVRPGSCRQPLRKLREQCREGRRTRTSGAICTLAQVLRLCGLHVPAAQGREDAPQDVAAVAVAQEIHGRATGGL
jgi:hypothetical protein